LIVKESEDGNVIEVCGLTKRYGRHVAVDRLSFSVGKGQIYGFLGPNGAGKSTTMNIMTGFLGATEGDVLIDGVSISENPDGVKRRIGYLPEQPPLYTDMTVSEYLSFAAELKKLPKPERRTLIEEAMEMTGIESVKNRLIRNLSKGYKQRVGLAQALLGYPEILILDEPMVGLDPKQIIEMRALIRGLAEKHTIILSSHILSEVQELCDTILIINYGRMVATGTPAELEQELAGMPELVLTVRGDGKKAEKALVGIPGVVKVTPAPCREAGAAAFHMKSAPDTDIREGVFRCCVEKNLPILQMERAGMTLEDVFLRLTAAVEPDETVPADSGSGDESIWEVRTKGPEMPDTKEETE